MKKLFFALGLMLSALALTNCSNNYDEVTPNVQGEEFEIFASTPSTKTVLGDGFVTSWKAGDAINLFCGADGSQGKFTTAAADGVFKGTLSGVDFTQENTWYAVYPYGEFLKTAAANADGDGYISFGNNCSQDGYNSYAHLTGKYAPLYGITTTDADNTQVAFQMHHLGSMVKVVVTNAADKAVTITSVKFATKNSAIGGGHFVDLTADPIAYKSAFPNPYKEITLTVKNGTALAPGAKAEFYIATLPFVAAAGEELTLAVTTTERGEDSVVKSLTSAVKFEAGHIKPLNFSYDKEATVSEADKNFSKMTSWDADLNGKYLLVVESKEMYLTSVGSEYGNGTAIDINKNTILGTDVNANAIITLEAGSTSDTYSFKMGGKYLQHTGSKNTLTLSTTKNTNTSWKVSISSGNVVILNAADNARKLQWNASSPRFACYTSAQTAIQLYKQDAVADTRPEAEMSFSAATATATMGEAFTAPTLTLNGSVVTGAVTGLIFTSSNTNVATVSNTGEVTLKSQGDVTITATYVNDAYKGEAEASYKLTVNPAAGHENDPVTVKMTSFSATSASMDGVISYTTAKGGGTSNPAVNGGEIRLYQGSPGGNITIKAAAGYKIQSITIGSSMKTTLGYGVDSATASVKNISMTAGGKYTLKNQSAQNVTFHCYGSDKNSRLYVNYLEVTYVKE